MANSWRLTNFPCATVGGRGGGGEEAHVVGGGMFPKHSLQVHERHLTGSAHDKQAAHGEAVALQVGLGHRLLRPFAVLPDRGEGVEEGEQAAAHDGAAAEVLVEGLVLVVVQRSWPELRCKGTHLQVRLGLFRFQNTPVGLERGV